LEGIRSKGMVQVYTGNGKGKTTAALGLGLRATGRGLRVKMVQFLKGTDTGELHSVRYLGKNFEILRYQKTDKFIWSLSKAEKKQLEIDIQEAWQWVQQIVEGNECQVLILDEILAVVENNLLDIEQILTLIASRPFNMEIVLTGRSLPVQILEAADLVTEMNEVKHYFHEGVPARCGIEY